MCRAREPLFFTAAMAALTRAFVDRASYPRRRGIQLCQVQAPRRRPRTGPRLDQHAVHPPPYPLRLCVVVHPSTKEPRQDGLDIGRGTERAGSERRRQGRRVDTKRLCVGRDGAKRSTGGCCVYKCGKGASGIRDLRAAAAKVVGGLLKYDRNLLGMLHVTRHSETSAESRTTAGDTRLYDA